MAAPSKAKGKGGSVLFWPSPGFCLFPSPFSLHRASFFFSLSNLSPIPLGCRCLWSGHFCWVFVHRSKCLSLPFFQFLPLLMSIFFLMIMYKNQGQWDLWGHFMLVRWSRCQLKDFRRKNEGQSWAVWWNLRYTKPWDIEFCYCRRKVWELPLKYNWSPKNLIVSWPSSSVFYSGKVIWSLSREGHFGNGFLLCNWVCWI